MLHPSTEGIAQSLEKNKRNFGIFFTPYFIIDLMLSLVKPSILQRQNIDILEPACGTAQFLKAFSEQFSSLKNKTALRGVDINPDFVEHINNQDICADFTVENADFLLWNSNEKYDLVLGNPPYGIPSFTEHYTLKVAESTKLQYKKQFETWRGKYNLYGAFIEKSVKILKPGGQLLFVVPSSFLLLDDFIKLRQFLSVHGSTELIYLGNDIFKPEAVVSAIIINFTKKDFGILRLFEYINFKNILIKESNNWRGEIVTFQTSESAEIDSFCPYKFGDFFNTNVSPRTPEIRNNPNILKSNIIYQDGYLPILGSPNLQRGGVNYSPISGNWVKETELHLYRGYYKIPHIVIALGFRGVGHLAAAYDWKSYPWMGDVYHVLPLKKRIQNTDILEDIDLVEWLNSETLGQYIKDVYRDATYHLNITQINNLPVPLKKTWDFLKAKESPRQGKLEL